MGQMEGLFSCYVCGATAMIKKEQRVKNHSFN